MTDPDSPTPSDDADASDGAGSERGVDARREPVADTDGRESPVDADRRARPRLANAPNEGTDTEEEDLSTNDPGELREPEPIEAETPRAENALFVLLGVLGTVALLATAIVPGLL